MLEKKKEAKKRLIFMGVNENVAKGLDSDVIYYSERAKMGELDYGILYWLSNNPEWTNIVKNIESKYNILVYHLTHEFTKFGECLSMLYVSNDKEEWDMDFDDLRRRSNGEMYPVGYVYNITYPECSQFGTIGVKEVAGGLIRTA